MSTPPPAAPGQKISGLAPAALPLAEDDAFPIAQGLTGAAPLAPKTRRLSWAALRGALYPHLDARIDAGLDGTAAYADARAEGARVAAVAYTDNALAAARADFAPKANPSFFGDASFAGAVTVGGDLVVNGATVTANAATVQVDDPVVTLGGDAPPAIDDGKDRGVEFRWHDGTGPRRGFFGFDRSTGRFSFRPDASGSGEVFAGAVGAFEGDLFGNVTGDVSGTASNVSGVVALANGGTGAIDAATAGGNLGLGSAATQPASAFATPADLAAKAPLASPAFTGAPTAPTASAGTSTTQVATTAFATAAANARQAADAGLSSLAALTGAGVVTATATDSFAMRAIGAAAATDILDRAAGDGRYSQPGHTQASSTITDFAEAVDDRVAALLVPGANVTLTYDDAANTLTVAATGGGTGGQPSDPGLTSLAALTGAGVVTATATDAFAMRAIGVAAASDIPDRAAADTRYAALASPALTGTPTAPTAAPGTNTTQLATTAFATAAANARQAADAGLASLAALTGAGVVTATATDTFAMRAIGAAAATDIPDRQAADGRYAPIASPAFTGRVRVGTAALADAATVATDGSAGNVFSVTLGGSRTLANPTNLAAGTHYLWLISQDATGSRTLSFGTAFKFPGGTAPTLSTAAGAVDVLSGYSDGTNVLCAALTKDVR